MKKGTKIIVSHNVELPTIDAGSVGDYLLKGGLVNPELMEHEKVRNLLIEFRKAARNLCLNITTCDNCEGSGKHHVWGRDACHYCGGTGKVCSQPDSSSAEDLLKLL